MSSSAVGNLKFPLAVRVMASLPLSVSTTALWVKPVKLPPTSKVVAVPAGTQTLRAGAQIPGAQKALGSGLEAHPTPCASMSKTANFVKWLTAPVTVWLVAL